MTSTHLSMIPVGKIVRVNAIQGGKMMTRRLMSLGISLGGEFEVVNHRGKGVVLGHDGNRIALGLGVADKLLVETID